ncbi:MAG: hypothetical protein M3461_10480 [Pseudomonadota bacterium]|nr:hypothetical protein [Pseudomonadota bacterium]
MQILTFQTIPAAGRAMAEHVLRKVIAKPDGSRFFLGLPTGSSPLPFFDAFVDLARELPDHYKSHLATLMHIAVMDDFVDHNTGANLSSSDEWSAVGFMRLRFLEALRSALAPATMANEGRILFPRVGHVRELRQQIIEQGGLDIQIVATDPYEGHVAQNFTGEPYRKTEEEKYARLSEAFIRHHEWAERYRGITFDLDDFTEMVCANPNGEFLLVVTGPTQIQSTTRVSEQQNVRPELPLSFLWRSADRTSVFTDMMDAAGLVTVRGSGEK